MAEGHALGEVLTEGLRDREGVPVVLPEALPQDVALVVNVETLREALPHGLAEAQGLDVVQRLGLRVGLSVAEAERERVVVTVLEEEGLRCAVAVVVELAREVELPVASGLRKERRQKIRRRLRGSAILCAAGVPYCQWLSTGWAPEGA